jgi:hypothetical protein
MQTSTIKQRSFTARFGYLYSADRADGNVGFWQILLQKSLMASANNDSVAVTMRFAAEAGDDGAAQSRSRAAVLFILS